MKARSIARELALLGVSQLNDNPKKADAKARGGSTSQPATTQQLEALLKKALKTLNADAQATIETARGELQRGERLVLESETRTVELEKVRSRIQPAVPLVQSAINHIGSTLELLMFAQQKNTKEIVAIRRALESAAQTIETGDRLLSENAQRVADVSDARLEIQRAIAAVQQAISDLAKTLDPNKFTQLIDREDIREYACDLLFNWTNHWRDLDAQLDDAMEKWSMRRLARVDRDILRLAMIEIVHLGVPTKVAIDEAIEIAKRYSDEDGYRFINGVLRRATDKLET
ncbi:MAG: transcription antitermination factor NusB [Phormidesmis sp.]